MMLSIPLSADIEARLRQRAAAAGKEPTAYAAQLLEQAVNRPSLDELLAPLRAEFAGGGASDEEVVGQINEAREGYRNQR